MNIKNLKEVLPFFKLANVTAFLWGPRGVGKTQGVVQYCSENDLDLREIRIGQMDIGDILGLPWRDEKEGVTRYYPPSWWPRDPDSKGVVFIDEINRGDRQTLQGIFQLVNERRLHEHFLPEGWQVVVAGNPNTDGYIVADVDDEAFMDRFCHLRVNVSHSEWVDYASEKEFSSHVVNYLKLSPSVLGNKEIEFPKFDEDVTPSPRSWDAVSRLLNAGLPDKFLMESCMGLVGVSATTAFVESMKDFDKPIKAFEILDHFTKVKSKLTTYSSLKGGRSDLIKVTAEDLTKELRKGEKETIAYTEAQKKNINSFIKTIPSDSAYAFLLSIINVGDWMKSLGSDKAVVELIKKAKGD